MPGAVSNSTDRELDKQNSLPSKCFPSNGGDGPVSKRGCQMVISAGGTQQAGEEGAGLGGCSVRWSG